MTVLTIGDRRVGDGADVFCIAEIGLAHEGSLGQAHAYIDLAADTGFDAVKFQTHLPEYESTPQEQFRVRVFPQDETRRDYWKRTAFEKSQWQELAAHSRERGLVFLSSPFSSEAVDLLLECGVPAWKVASGEVTNRPMLGQMAATGLPLLISSGMSGWAELTRTVDLVRAAGASVGLFQCTSAYPCPPDQWGLNVIGEMKQRFGCPVGLSDHSGTIVPGLAAVALGAVMLEVHIAFSKQQFGPDAPASLEPPQCRQLTDGVRALSAALARPVDKDAQAQHLQPLRDLFMKSAVAARSLPAGHRLTPDDLAYRKPGTGISAWDAEQLVGRRLRRSVPADHFFCFDDLTDEQSAAEEAE